MFDFKLIPELRSLSKNLVVIIDNTWLTEVIFNPFLYGADIVVASMTKYYSGGTAIGGYIATSNTAYHENFMEWISLNGLHTSPHNALVIRHNMETMVERINASSKLTVAVVHKLQESTSALIRHPSLSNHINYTMCRELFKDGLYPSVFTIKLNCSKSKLLKIVKKSCIMHKTSFGSKLSRTDPWPTIEDTGVILRVAIGWDDTEENIIDGMMQIIDACLRK
jgi:cystathionine beta-lyase/cystathionine gamma-synthase